MAKQINIRKETSADHRAVFDLLVRAFENEPHSDHKEQLLVEKLRKSPDFIAELSLVAEIDGEIAGYILLSQIHILDAKTKGSTPSLALAPVAVLPKYQHQGIGSQLIRHAHQLARRNKFHSVVVLGHADYYPKFGYKNAIDFGVRLPFDVPQENAMIMELTEGALDHTCGTVQYPKEFLD